MKLDYANSSLRKAKIAVLGFPFDRTSSFIPGSRFAPQFIRQSSYNIEAYSLYHRMSVHDLSICDLGDYSFDRADPIKSIEDEVRLLYQKKKQGVFLGGEHTITLGIVRALRRFYRDLCVVQFDAHADLRHKFLGEKVCHATVMKRVVELIGRPRLFQLGIRSGLKEELEKSQNLYRLTVLEHVGKVKRAIGRRPVYFSVDVDVLDPGVLPAVSTPEPGGISYRELAQSLVKLKGLHLVGADVVEYNPLAASPFPSGSVVAGLLKELILCFKK